ncbi:hypothetical protein ACOSP7_015244 [Xanthoceras sorbifolium]
MMLGEPHRPNPTVHVPPWPPLHEDPTADIISSQSINSNDNSSPDFNNPYYLQEALAALQRYLPSNEPELDLDSDVCGLDPDSPVDAYSCDQFRMFEFKVRKCARGRSHDWTECPYAHPGEKARRRDPRKYHYSGTACPDFRKGSCKKGDSCEFAHGVFECWLHPARYRTQPCKDGPACKRRVCFFAHTPDQLRILPQQSPRSIDASSCAMSLPFLSSPESISPPMSPRAESPMSQSLGSSSINEMVASLRNLQLGKVKSLPSSWNKQIGCSSGYGSPRGSVLRPGFYSLPSTPTKTPTRPGIGYLDFFDESCEEEPVMERVESGRGLRAKMFEKLSKENSLDRAHPFQTGGAPDVGWVSDLVNEMK